MRPKGRFVGSAHYVGWIPYNGQSPYLKKKGSQKQKGVSGRENRGESLERERNWG